MTTIDQVKAMILAPSTQLKTNEIVGVLNFMFQWRAMDMAGIYRKLEDLMTPLEYQEEETPPSELTIYANLFKRQREGTLYMGTKEASGYGQLSDYLLCIRDMMQILHQVSVQVDAQFQIEGKGKTFSADGSLVVALIDSSVHVPVCVVEYKPRVPAAIGDTDPYYLSEFFLQAYYLQLKHHHPILHVLTDLTDFHCFQMKSGQILKYQYTLSPLAEPQVLLKHSNYICSILKEICESQLIPTLDHEV